MLSSGKILTICAVSWAICCSVVFYAQMAQEEGRFNFDDICAAISDKLERRHPHIFGEASAGNSTEVPLAGSKSKARSGRKKPSIRHWTIFPIACRR